jgi:hypothetical protein
VVATPVGGAAIAEEPKINTAKLVRRLEYKLFLTHQDYVL